MSPNLPAWKSLNACVISALVFMTNGPPMATGWPIGYATSVKWPELPVRELGLGSTAPATLQHFVGYPAVAFTVW